MFARKKHAFIGMPLVVLMIMTAAAQVTTWTGGGDGGDWFDGANWDHGVPSTGATGIVNSGGILLTNSSADLAAFMMTGGTLTFSNWNTKLSAQEIMLLTNAAVTLPAAFDETPGASNNIYFAASNVTVGAGVSINANARGYRSGNGPGKPRETDNRSAASHGGRGGWPNSGDRYGSIEMPLAPGSGGKTNNAAAQGGGAVRIEATGVVRVDGTLSANGANASGNYTGGGSGGSIYIACRTLAGSNGIVRANGGNHGGNSGGGGGGRIAVAYDPVAQSNEPVPAIVFSVLPGSGSYPGDIGTLYFPDSRLLTETIAHSGQWLAPGLSHLTATALTIANANIRFPNDNFRLEVAGDLTISGAAARLWLGACDFSGLAPYAATATNGPTVTVGGDLIVTNGAQLHVFSGVTNAATAYGARVAVTGTIAIASGSTIRPYAHHELGAAVLWTARRLAIAAGGTLNAGALGYTQQTGPGKGSARQRGAGYGGEGGYAGGPVYGYSNAPVLPGSGGGVGSPSFYPHLGRGGGLVRVEVESARVDGDIRANGAGGSGAGSGGASGGGIFIVCKKHFEGVGELLAIGGNSGGSATSGGGGGGRIAVWQGVRNIAALRSRLASDPSYIARPLSYRPRFSGTVAVQGGNGFGVGNAGEPGTVMFIQGPRAGILVSLR